MKKLLAGFLVIVLIFTGISITTPFGAPTVGFPKFLNGQLEIKRAGESSYTLVNPNDVVLIDDNSSYRITYTVESSGEVTQLPESEPSPYFIDIPSFAQFNTETVTKDFMVTNDQGLQVKGGEYHYVDSYNGNNGSLHIKFNTEATLGSTGTAVVEGPLYHLNVLDTAQSFTFTTAKSNGRI